MRRRSTDDGLRLVRQARLGNENNSAKGVMIRKEIRPGLVLAREAHEPQLVAVRFGTAEVGDTERTKSLRDRHTMSKGHIPMGPLRVDKSDGETPEPR